MFTVGYVIKNLRKQQRITQEKLCEGICTPSYLSKIENGDANVSDSTINSLLQRLGQESSKYIVFKTEKELIFQNKLYNLRQLYASSNFNLHKILLEELFPDFDKYEPPIKQFLQLHNFFSLVYYDRCTSTEALIMLKQALSLTKQDIDLDNLRNELFTQDEIMIILNIALTIHKENDSDRAIKILEQLRTYLEDSRISPEFYRRPYSLVLINLCSFWGMIGRYYEALACCDKGIQFCINNSHLEFLARFTYNKGYCLGKLGNRSEAILYITRAYHVALASGNQHSANHYMQHLIDNYDFKL